ncbi:MAG: YdeI/OmpD-associated family protein [Anaerolineae bacterium]|nr:DUF1905 domain-containing protein [Anaerolineae bacterium]
MKATFTTTILKDAEINATGINVPPEIIKQFGKGKKPPVKVTINGFTYRSTVAAYGDVFMLPLSQERRAAAGITPGDTVEVTLELDEEPRTVEVPDDLAAALEAKAGARAAFDKLAYSARKEFVRQVTEAKAQETRERRIAGIVAKMGGE